MKYLESFNIFSEQDTIQIREISNNEILNIVINEINHPGLSDRKTASEIYCDDIGHRGLKYKNCGCSKTDSNYLNLRIKREFYNVNGEYASIKGKKFINPFFDNTNIRLFF